MPEGPHPAGLRDALHHTEDRRDEPEDLRGEHATKLVGDLHADALVALALVFHLDDAERADILCRADVRAAIDKHGYKIGGERPEEFQKFVRNEVEKFARVIKAANVQVD